MTLSPFVGEGDQVLIVEYPSVESFLTMQRDQGYQKMLEHCSNGLADTHVYFAVEHKG